MQLMCRATLFAQHRRLHVFYVSSASVVDDVVVTDATAVAASADDAADSRSDNDSRCCYHETYDAAADNGDGHAGPAAGATQC